jgi:hypothetical protein
MGVGRPPGGNVKYKNGRSIVYIDKAAHQALSQIAVENEITLNFLSNYIVSEFLKDDAAVATAVEIGRERVIADKMREVQKKLDALHTELGELESQSKWSYRVD